MSGQNVVAIGGEDRALSPTQIAGAVREFRERLDLKQSALAERAGVTERTIQRVERGERIKDEALRQIANALFLGGARIRRRVLHPIPGESIQERVELH